MSLFRSLLAAVIVASCAPTGVLPLAENRLHDWSCPQAGTTTKWETSSGGHGTTHFDGADLDTPDICRWHDASRRVRSLFLVTPVNGNLTTEERDGLRNAARTLLNGQSQLAGFTDRRDNQQVTHLWRVVGEEDLHIGERTIRAVLISSQNTSAGNGRSWSFTRWYDPDRHLWLRTLDGSNGNEWRVVAIADPA